MTDPVLHFELPDNTSEHGPEDRKCLGAGVKLFLIYFLDVEILVDWDLSWG